MIFSLTNEFRRKKKKEKEKESKEKEEEVEEEEEGEWKKKKKENEEDWPRERRRSRREKESSRSRLELKCLRLELHVDFFFQIKLPPLESQVLETRVSHWTLVLESWDASLLNSFANLSHLTTNESVSNIMLNCKKNPRQRQHKWDCWQLVLQWQLH